MAQAILLTGRERRRRWSRDERAEILAAAFAPDGIVSEVARRFDVSTGLIYTWRRQALAAEVGPAFVPARVVGLPSNGGVETAGSRTWQQEWGGTHCEAFSNGLAHRCVLV
jgi:transposase